MATFQPVAAFPDRHKISGESVRPAASPPPKRQPAPVIKASSAGVLKSPVFFCIFDSAGESVDTSDQRLKLKFQPCAFLLLYPVCLTDQRDFTDRHIPAIQKGLMPMAGAVQRSVRYSAVRARREKPAKPAAAFRSAGDIWSTEFCGTFANRTVCISIPHALEV